MGMGMERVEWGCLVYRLDWRDLIDGSVLVGIGYVAFQAQSGGTGCCWYTVDGDGDGEGGWHLDCASHLFYYERRIDHGCGLISSVIIK